MLLNLADLHDCTIEATDGRIGEVKDCYFDDEAWVVRYFVVKTGEWLMGRDVLISRSCDYDPSSERMRIQRFGVLPYREIAIAQICLFRRS